MRKFHTNKNIYRLKETKIEKNHESNYVIYDN